ncbi:MAG: ATP-binding protein [Prosthecobacter sp.]
MFDTNDELLRHIQLGEDSLLECKQVLFRGDRIQGPSSEKMADEIAAMSNAAGGVIVLGVDDRTHDIAGIDASKLELTEAWLREIIETRLEPPVQAYTLRRIELPDGAGSLQPVIRLDLPRSLFVHRSPGGYKIRAASSVREMSPEYLARLFQQRSQSRLLRFDEQLVPAAPLEALSDDLWRRFVTTRTFGEDKDLLAKLKLADADEEGIWHPTVSGLLMACRSPQDYLPSAFIQAVAYRGTEASPADLAAYQLDAKDIQGPLDQQIAEACRFVARNMKVGASKALGRHDLPQYNLTAVFEAVANAVSHRDYAIYGQKVRLRLFEDRLELFSPGSIPNTMTVESLEFRQASRNENLTSLLAKCPVPGINGLDSDRSTIMDKRGEGVPIILQLSERVSGRRPFYRLLDGDELQLTIYAASFD